MIAIQIGRIKGTKKTNKQARFTMTKQMPTKGQMIANQTSRIKRIKPDKKQGLLYMANNIISKMRLVVLYITNYKLQRCNSV